MGRVDESTMILKKRHALDPYSISSQESSIIFLSRSGRTEEAIQLAKNKTKSDPEEPTWYWDLAIIYSREGKYNEAIKQLQIQIPLMKGDIVDEVALLGHLYGRTGRREQASQMLERLDELSRQGKYVSPALKAWIYSGLNDTDEAILWLTRGYEARAHRMGIDINGYFNFIFEPIRDDSRFKDLLRKMNLEPW